VVSGRRRLAAGLLLVSACAVAGTCGGGSGGGGRGAVTETETPPIQNLDARCAALPEAFPPGFAFVPDRPGRAVVASLGVTQTLIPFDIESSPPEIAPDVPVLGIPLDSDGDGAPEGVPGGVARAPILDDVFAVDAGLGFATATGYEEVILFRPGAGALLTVEVEVPAGLPPGDYPFLPAPGVPALRTAISTRACVRPPAGAVDSRGEPLESALSSFCDPGVPSFRTSFTSGVALVGGHLFVSTSNLGADRGTANTQFLPGTVLVYEFDRSAAPPRVRPHPERPVLFTGGFNPTHVTGYRAGNRDLVLVTVSGALGIEGDDPSTKPVEGAGVPLSDAFIDVIDAETLERVGSIPLGPATPAFDGLAIDPSGRVAVAGSAIQRALYAVDLAPLAELPRTGPPVTLVRDEAVIFDADAPFRIPALADGAPPQSCPGETFGVSFDAAGRRVLASDFCDGTLAEVQVDLTGSPTTAQLRDRFLLLDLVSLVAPLREDTLGEPRAPGRVAVRPGRPGLDFQGPEVFFLVGQEEGLLCGISMAPR